MSAGFADLLALQGVWLGGRKRTTETPARAGALAEDEEDILLLLAVVSLTEE